MKGVDNIADQPGQKPLNFVRSSPRNGATGVSTSLKTALLVFDKNVVNDAVWENNRKQVTMWRGTTKIGIRVIRIKDTVDFSKRINIYVKPNNKLRSLTNYKIVISPNLTAKNGQKLGETVTIKFKTARRPVTPEE